MSAQPEERDYPEGFAPRRLADVQREMNEALAEIIDPRSGERPFRNASDDAVLQQIVAIFAEAVAGVENAAKNAFDQRDPLTAVGAGLSALVQLNGVIRKPGAASVVPLTLSGRPGTLIPAGSLVGTADGRHRFRLEENTVLPAEGEAEVRGVSAEKGPVDPAPGTVAAILSPVSGWRSVANGPALSVGSVEETDELLRRRQQLSTNATAYRQIEAIRAAVLNVPGVSFCRAYQNSGLAPDERGIPGKSLALAVVGGDDRAIARAMLYRTPLGVGWHGEAAVPFEDALGLTETVRFSRPVERPVSLAVTLEIMVDERVQLFPSNGPELVRRAILKFAEYGRDHCEPLGNPGFPPGQNIVRSQLYTPVNSIGGARVVSIRMGVDGEEPEDREIIPIAWNEIGVFAAERIEVDFA